MACLDTNVLVDLLRSPRRSEHHAATDVYRRLVERGEEICATRISEAELRVGLHVRGNDLQERKQTDDLLATLVLLELGQDGAEHYGRLKAHLRRIGRPVGDADLLIAATAVAHDQALITRNPSHFGDMAGLIVVSY